jgi:hypothetical protein
MQDYWNDPPEEPELPEWICQIEDCIEEAIGFSNEAKERINAGHKHDNRPAAFTESVNNLQRSVRSLAQAVEFLLRRTERTERTKKKTNHE